MIRLGMNARAVVEERPHPLSDSAMRLLVQGLVIDGDVDLARDIVATITENTWMDPPRFLYWMGVWDMLSAFLGRRRNLRFVRAMRALDLEERADARTLQRLRTIGGAR